MQDRTRDSLNEITQEWDVASIHLVPNDMFNWGISNENVLKALNIVKTFEQYEQIEKDQNKINYQQYKDLVYYLYQMDFIDSDINLAITKANASLEKGKRPLDFNHIWILVAGTGNSQFSELEQMMSKEIGQVLAANGYGVICGGWPGVDQEIAKSFTLHLASHQISEKDRLIQLIERKMKPLYDYGTIQELLPGEDWYNIASAEVRAVILIGGKGGTYKTYEEAIKNGVPVIPIPGTGGDALRIHKILSSTSSKYSADSPQTLISATQLAALNREILIKDNLGDISAVVIDIIKGLPQKTVSRPSSDDFKAMIMELYKKRKVVIEDDLQKNRWGGRSEDQGNVLSVKVSKSIIPTFFNVILNLKVSDPDKREQFVAFFLHDSFSNEIRFKSTKNGSAKLEVRSYEAFTVGAYTEKGIMLELDLNEVSGLPKAFYYTDVSKAFKKLVDQMYEQQNVTVKDDLQKNRWGGKSVSNEKELTASVEKGLIPGYFDVRIKISSTNPNKPLKGDVAFFMHDSFKEIKFRKAIDGIAKVKVSAYEAFTVGAYTEDGTILELDLQESKGFPKKFYY
ncbi:hypothetical protein DBR11_14410 [Pedobacter sp. HMWF019]|uniref:pYEATS domain-containing protein n=1 Tax=Pedobacter sp. HMWF019 TaxID=2056856 RepID=UPI000D3B7FA9|nr:pYEATS domain-containing protein [Pedobacter sp. HMWF019]PTS98633.1 hypothetical protein DBR11_14410 [Pedobacter sp. HMWF019]